MYNFILSTHSHTRWLIFVTAVVAIVLPFLNNNSITKKDKMPALAFLIMCDIQLIMGIMLYFVYSPFGMDAFSLGMKEVMSNSEIRKIAVEHITMMLLAIILVHIGYSKLKMITERAAFRKTSLIYFGLALVLILAAIPWATLKK